MSKAGDQRGTMEAADAAAHWFARLQDPSATGEDWLAFEQWLGASVVHAEAYERLETLWVELDERGGEIEAALDAPAELAAFRARRSGKAGISRRVWIAAGALMAASVVAGVVGVTTVSVAPAETYATPAGRTRQVALADGTTVWLNAQSQMTVRLGRGRRNVEMAEGEAVFDVAHDPNRPFLIHAGAHEVRVVGTRFNLRQRPEAFALTVSRGIVEVRPSGVSGAAPTRLVAGQRLSQGRGASAEVRGVADPEADAAWMHGQLVYSNAPLTAVAADLSRSLGTPVHVADAATGRIRFTGVLAIDDRKAVLHRLEAFAPVRAERGPSGVVLRRR